MVRTESVPLACWCFKDQIVPPDDADKLRVQTVTFIEDQPNLLAAVFSPEHRLEADVPLFTY